jgi:glucokinase
MALRQMAQELERSTGACNNSALARMAREDPEFQAKDVAHLAEMGDAGAQAVFDEMGRCLGLALAALVNTLDLPLNVLGGGSAAAWPLFAPAMLKELEVRSYVYRATMPNEEERTARAQGKTHVVVAELGAESGLLGAASLPWIGTP